MTEVINTCESTVGDYGASGEQKIGFQVGKELGILYILLHTHMHESTLLKTIIRPAHHHHHILYIIDYAV